MPGWCASWICWRGARGTSETPERLAGVYRVLKPHLIAAYETHLAHANPVYEPPTRRILERCLEEERRHAAAGQVVLAALTPGFRAAPACRGVGGGVDRGAAGGGRRDRRRSGRMRAPRRARSRSRRRHRAGKRLRGPRTSRRSAPRDRSAPPRRGGWGPRYGGCRQAASDVREHVRAEYAKLAPPLTGSEIVGVARIGAHRMIKLVFQGPGGLTVVQQQWRPTASGVGPPRRGSRARRTGLLNAW